jgi:Flp pilus assembly protein TadG
MSTMERLRDLRRDERGISNMLVGFGFVGFIASTTLALDVGMWSAARSQAQNAADAGALAGAIALGFDDYENRSASGPAVQNAVTAALENKVMNGDVLVTPDDVTFPLSPTGADNRVRVEVSSTINTVFGSLFGMPTMDIRAAAIAEAAPANAMTCVKPFIIPDRWREPDGQFSTQTDTFEMYDNRGNLVANPDVYVPSGPNYTGYNAESSRGTRLTLRAGSGHNIQPTFYYSLALGDETGGADYDWNIANCNRTIVRIGSIVIQEPGNMVGPTVSGAELLVAKDPNAYWDESKNTVVSTHGGQSPRVFPIPLYDPIHYSEGKANGRFASFKVANWIGFFLERIQGNEIYGRMIPIAGIADDGAPAPDHAFPIAIRLVG